ncbi:unnamed protein product [Angiostrongylus costaricensis]|uniref:GPI transamidase component PIG-S n=1 Tax=Angiostrongylus costaricensis TaxID=334426 RepID=A0A158PIE9_ANGCS|nr:unnamed protein product [Angiostrongylus costaricensis]
MNGIICRVKSFMGINRVETKEGEEIPPKNMTEVIQSLPESYHKYMGEELPYRRASALTFIAIVLGMGTPLWYHTTRTYRAPFVVFPKSQTVSFNVQIHLTVTDAILEPELNSMCQNLSSMLLEGEVKPPLDIWWEVLNQGVRELRALENDRMEPSDLLAVHVAVVPLEQWSHFSAVTVFLDRGRWAFLQYTVDSNRLMERLQSLVWEVMVDVPHMNEIVKRDIRERLQPWQITALSPSHQKRLVWDSAPLSMNYIVQVIHVHDNASPSDTYSKDIVNVLEVFIDSQLQSVESSYPVLKIVIMEVDAPVIMLDPFGEDSRGVAVASWGAIIPRICVGETSEDPQTAARILSALRVLLGVDSDLPASWKRAPVPLADWEIERMRLRAILDNAMRAISAVSALKALTEKITNVVINDDVAARANEAVHLVQAGLESPGAPQLNKNNLFYRIISNSNFIQISAGRFLADEALSHPSLLSLLYFPKDQTMAVYLPIMLPTLIPLFGSALALCKWALGWS